MLTLHRCVGAHSVLFALFRVPSPFCLTFTPRLTCALYSSPRAYHRPGIGRWHLQHGGLYSARASLRHNRAAELPVPGRNTRVLPPATAEQEGTGSGWVHARKPEHQEPQSGAEEWGERGQTTGLHHRQHLSGNGGGQFGADGDDLDQPPVSGGRFDGKLLVR